MGSRNPIGGFFESGSCGLLPARSFDSARDRKWAHLLQQCPRNRYRVCTLPVYPVLIDRHCRKSNRISCDVRALNPAQGLKDINCCGFEQSLCYGTLYLFTGNSRPYANSPHESTAVAATPSRGAGKLPPRPYHAPRYRAPRVRPEVRRPGRSCPHRVLARGRRGRVRRRRRRGRPSPSSPP